MLHRLAPNHFTLAQPIFGAQHHLAVNAALAGEAPAELYVDDPLAPALAGGALGDLGSGASRSKPEASWPSAIDSEAIALA